MQTTSPVPRIACKRQAATQDRIATQERIGNMSDGRVKPVYKRWWFWALILIAAFAAFQLRGGLMDDTDAPVYGPEREEASE